MFHFQVKKSKKMVAAYVAAVLCMASAGVYAATEHWNDASLTPQVTTKTSVSDQTDWNQWKANWDNTKTNYEAVSIAPGADFSKLNFGWLSKDKAGKSEVRVADNKDMKGAKTFKGTVETGTVIGGTQYYSNKVTIDGLQKNRLQRQRLTALRLR